MAGHPAPCINLFHSCVQAVPLLVSVSSRPSFIFARVSYHGHFLEHGHYRGQNQSLHQKTLDHHRTQLAV